MEENRTEELKEESAAPEETTSVEQTTPAEEIAPAEEVAPAEEAAPAEQTPAVETDENKEAPKATAGKLALVIAAIVVVLAVIIALLAAGSGNGKNQDAAVSDSETAIQGTIPADGNPDDETCKGTYTASDAEVAAAGDVVVATAGEYQLTNNELQIYYWLGVQSFLQNCSYYSNSYGVDYAAMIGLDYTQPFDTQICPMVENGATWQQFFLLNALDSWHYYQSLYAEATQAGFDVTADKREFLDNLETSIAEDATANGFASAEDFLVYNAGAGATMESYKKFMEQNYRGYDYYESLVNALEISDADLESYYAENEETFIQQGIPMDHTLMDVRHILIKPESTTAEDGTAVITDEAWAACEAEAQRILKIWETGGDAQERETNGWQAEAGTEDFFAELANTFTRDGNDTNYDGVPDGGLYTGVYQGRMVEPFDNWCFDESRVTGDTDLVQTTYGWHVMYFVQRYPSMQWKSYADQALREVRADLLLEEIVGKYTLSVDYSKIVLGYLNLDA